MSQFDMPPSFSSAGYWAPGSPAPHTPPPPPPPARGEGGGASRPFLFCLLILACVGLGALLNWAVREHHARTSLAQANVEISKSYTVVLANRNDLASFLTDERTKLYRLAGRDDAAGRSVTVAWQEQSRTGILIGDRMPVAPDGRVFAMWHLEADGRPTLCGTFLTEATGTFHNFRAPLAANATSDAGTSGFRVTLEPETERNLRQPTGPVVYETR